MKPEESHQSTDTPHVEKEKYEKPVTTRHEALDIIKGSAGKSGYSYSSLYRECSLYYYY